jgi:signal transduction histidine kinase
LGFVAPFPGAEHLAHELADLVIAADAPLPLTAALAHGTRRAEEDAGPEQLVREFTELRAAIATGLERAVPDLDPASAQALHALLDRHQGACTAAYLREREARLLAMVAHDLSNPLMSMALCQDYLDVAAGDAIDASTVRDTLQHVVRQLRQLTRGLHDVVDLQVGPSPPGREPIIVAELVAELVARHQPDAAARGARIEPELALGRAAVLGEREPLGRALGTMLQRAVRATSGGRVVPLHGAVVAAEVVLRFGEHPDPELAVQARASTEMFVVRSVVSAHGGRIWTEADQHGGRFALSLPLAT